MITGTAYDLLEVTATVYEIGARGYLHQGCFGDDDLYFEHNMVILPEPLRHYDRWNKDKFETSPEFYPEYGTMDGKGVFITKIPFIGVDFRHIGECAFSTDHHERLSALDCDLSDIGHDVYSEFLPQIMEEINVSIDGILDRLPIVDKWKEPALRYVFRFTVAIEHIYEKYYVWDAWAYEYDQSVHWMGRVDIRSICKQFNS